VITITTAEARLWPVKVYAEYRTLRTLYRLPGMTETAWAKHQCDAMTASRCWRNEYRPGKSIKRGRVTADEMVILIRR
jgi:hypothetical protein